MKCWSLLCISLLLITSIGCTSPEGRMARGDEYSRQGRFAQALREYQIAKRKDPALYEIDRKIHNAQIWLYLQQGDQAAETERWTEAERAFEEVRRLDPDHPQIDVRFEKLSKARSNWHFLRGQKFLSTGNPYDAIPEFEQCLYHWPEHPRAEESLARAERDKRDRQSRSATAYEQGIRALKANRYELAIRRLQEALRLDPTHPTATLELENASRALVQRWIDEGDSAAAEDHWPDALSAYQSAMELDPENRAIRHRLHRAEREVEATDWIQTGDLALQEADWAKAFDCFAHARYLTSDPERVEYRYSKARVGYATHLFRAAQRAESEGRYEDALANYRVIIDFYPEFRDVVAVCESLNVRLEDAETAYQAGCEAVEHGNLSRAQERLQACLASVNDYLDAEERLTRVDRNLQLADSLYQRACRSQLKGDTDRARVLFEECLSVTRPYRDIAERLGAVRSEVLPSPDSIPEYEEACRAQARRDLQRARELFMKVEQRQPGYRDISTRMDEIRSVLARARKLYEGAREAEQKCNLTTARDGFQKCLELTAPFEDSTSRLEDLNGALRIFRRARRLDRQRDLFGAVSLYGKVVELYDCHPVSKRRIEEIEDECDRIAGDYGSMVEAQRAEEFRKALKLALSIRKRCIDYKDVEKRTPVLESEADYADARAFEEDERFEEALRGYERCIQRKSSFRDAKKRADLCRRKMMSSDDDDDDGGGDDKDRRGKRGDRGRGQGQGRGRGDPHDD